MNQDNKKTAARRKLFRLYAKNLSRFIDGDGSIYKCPICGASFTENEVESNGCLTLGHIWPDAVGGDIAVLECKKDNSELGSYCDSHISKEYNLCNAFQNNGKIDALVESGGHRMLTEFHLEGPGQLRFKTISAASNQKSIEAFIEQYSSAQKTGSPAPGFSMQIIKSVPDQLKLEIALLHSAYLRLGAEVAKD